MSVSDKIDNALNEVLNEAIASKKVSKILSLLTDEILKLCEKNISVKEQCEVINKAFNIKIKESAYSAYYYRNIKPLMNKKTSIKEEEFIENSNNKKTKKQSNKTTPKINKKEVEKPTAPVAPKELTNNKSVKEIFKQTITHKSDLEDYL